MPVKTAQSETAKRVAYTLYPSGQLRPVVQTRQADGSYLTDVRQPWQSKPNWDHRRAKKAALALAATLTLRGYVDVLSDVVEPLGGA